MPPKKPPNQPTKKTEQKKKEKIIEDKTFGLKNKKGSKQQKFIKTVHTQVTQVNDKTRKAVLTEQEKAKQLKEQKEKEKEELNRLFKPVQQTVGKGVDPKSVLCAFFKQGLCAKGDKCKFSHDLAIHRKTEKRSMYEDTRDAPESETMENWDIDKLNEVVETKMGKNKQPTTNIICKYFLDAVEKSTYGWFWECPNGDKCIYKHCLPPGYVLKKDIKKVDKENEISMEELIEKERAALGSATTKVTLQSFLEWKERKKKERVENAKAEEERKKNEYKMGRFASISGREMFEFNPDLVGDDDVDEGEDVMAYIKEEDEADTDVQDVQLEYLSIAPPEADSKDAAQRLSPTESLDECESDKLGEATVLPTVNHTGAGDIPAATGDVVIDEDLFLDDEIDDFDDDDDD